MDVTKFAITTIFGVRNRRRLGIAVVRSPGLARRPVDRSGARRGARARRASRPRGTGTSRRPGLSLARPKLPPSKSHCVLSIVQSDGCANSVRLFFFDGVLCVNYVFLFI